MDKNISFLQYSLNNIIKNEIISIILFFAINQKNVRLYKIIEVIGIVFLITLIKSYVDYNKENCT